MATTGQLSYPYNSEKASPFGTCTVYLSLAARVVLPKDVKLAIATITNREGMRFMTAPPLRNGTLNSLAAAEAAPVQCESLACYLEIACTYEAPVSPGQHKLKPLWHAGQPQAIGRLVA